MQIAVTIPPWLQQLNAQPRRFANEEEAMRCAIEASRRNLSDGGGPFGAAIINEDLDLIALGTNRVVPDRASLLHAEMVAVLLAQRRLNNHDLRALGNFTLVTSCEPCAMCFGAIPFAGVRRVVCGATKEDAQAIGFDEGDRPYEWQQSLLSRGISVQTEVLRSEAAAVLNAYLRAGGTLY